MEFVKAVAISVCVFGAMEAASALLTHSWSFFGNRSFSGWEGLHFGYPEVEGWRPPYLKHFVTKVLIPALIGLLLLRSFPPVVVSPLHKRDYVAVLLFQAVVMIIFHLMGQGESYADVGKAFAVAIPGFAFVWIVRRLPVPGKDADRRFSGGWLVPIMLVAWGFVVLVRPGAIVTMFLFNLLAIGFAEEYAFRGVIQGYLLARCPGPGWLGISKANWVTAVLFAWMHNPSLDPQQVPWLLFTFAMGLAFGEVRERTGSWLAPAVAHGANAFYWLYVMLASGAF